MKCPQCQSPHLVKNGISRHGYQRFICRSCRKTFGDQDHRRVDPQKRKAALQHYLEGVGQRAIERLVGVSHNSVMNWVLEETQNKALKKVNAEQVEWVEVDELWSFVGKKNNLAGCGGLLIVLPKRFAGGRWGIVAPKQPSDWLRNFLVGEGLASARTSGTHMGRSSKRVTT